MMPVLEALVPHVLVPVSIDTSKAAVARAAMAAGAEIINDVTALQGDPAMLEVARQSQAGLCVMHMRGTPQTMQDDPSYDDVVGEVFEFLRDRRDALVAAGIELPRIALDPGIGFGKTHAAQPELVGQLPSLSCIGVSCAGGSFAQGLHRQSAGRQVGRCDRRHDRRFVGAGEPGRANPPRARRGGRATGACALRGGRRVRRPVEMSPNSGSRIGHSAVDWPRNLNDTCGVSRGTSPRQSTSPDPAITFICDVSPWPLPNRSICASTAWKRPSAPAPRPPSWQCTNGAVKNAWLRRAAELLRTRQRALAEANVKDIAAAPGFGLSDAQIDRLRLTPQVIESMAAGARRGCRAARADRRGDRIDDAPQRVGSAQRCACRWAWCSSFTSRGPTSRPTPRPFASKAATP